MTKTIQLDVKVVHQRFMSWQGVMESWGIIVNGKPKAVFYSLAETRAYLRGLGVEHGGD